MSLRYGMSSGMRSENTVIRLEKDIFYKRNTYNLIGISNKWYPIKTLNENNFKKGIEKLLEETQLSQDKKDAIRKNIEKLYKKLKNFVKGRYDLCI